jgi:hypothetical protein
MSKYQFARKLMKVNLLEFYADSQEGRQAAGTQARRGCSCAASKKRFRIFDMHESLEIRHREREEEEEAKWQMAGHSTLVAVKTKVYPPLIAPITSSSNPTIVLIQGL